MTSELLLQTQPFGDVVLDVAAVNAHASDMIAARIDEVQEQAKRGTTAATHAYAILGAAGAGKTHLFARLRHRHTVRPTMILLRPYFGVAMTPRDILAACIDQLCATHAASTIGTPAASQLTRLISAWISPPESATGKSKRKITVDLSKLPSKERRIRLAAAISNVISAMPAAMPAAHLVRALLGMRWLSDEDRWAELAWLSGRQAQPARAAWASTDDEPDATAVGTTSGPAIVSSGDKLSEGDVLFMLRLLAHLAAPIAPLTIVFDQLENLASDDETRVLAYGNVISELVDSVPGLTIVQLALTSEWLQYIEPRLSLPQRSRVAARVTTLSTPSAGERTALLHLWHQQLFPSADETLFPHPLTPAALQELLHEPGVTPRQLLASLQTTVADHRRFGPASLSKEKPGMRPSGESVDSPPTSIFPVDEHAVADHHALDRLWQSSRAQVEAEFNDKVSKGLPCDDAALAEAVHCALQFCDGIVTASRQDRSHLVTEVYQDKRRLTLVFITGLHHSALTASLAKATELAVSGRVLLVRESRFELPDAWPHVQARRDEFESNPAAGWLWLQPEDVVQCLTLARLQSAARALRLRLPGHSALVSSADLIIGLRQLLNPGQWPIPQRINQELDKYVVPTMSAGSIGTTSSVGDSASNDAVNRVDQVNAAPVISDSNAFRATATAASSNSLPPNGTVSVANWLQQGRQIGSGLLRGAFKRLRGR